MVKLFANAIVFSAGFAAGMLVGRRPESRTGEGDDTSDEASARPAPRRGFTQLHEGGRSRDSSASRPADGSPSAADGRLLAESPNAAERLAAAGIGVASSDDRPPQNELFPERTPADSDEVKPGLPDMLRGA